MSQNPTISLHDFQKLDLRVGTIVDVNPIKGSNKLYKIIVSLGELGERQTVAGLALYYQINELKGRKVAFLNNLKPAKLAGEISEGMILAAEEDDKIAILTFDRDISEGAQIL